jgi:copper chaperone CopZ
MKKLGIVLLALGFLAACGEAEKKADESVDLAKYASAEVNVPTIQCSSCVKTIKKGTVGKDGVKEIKINLETKVATVYYDKSATDVVKIEKAIAATGYDANETVRDMAAYDELADCCQIPEGGSDGPAIEH